MRKTNLSRVAAIFGQALDKAPDDQRAFVEAQTQDDEVRKQVFRMLAAHEQSTGFIHTAGGLGDLTTLEDGAIVGSWRVKGRLGAGGMGEVYEAERFDGHFDQTAALKLIGSSDPKLWKRFATERQILADLEHPGISRLIDGGVADDGKPFLVMERIEGEELTGFAAKAGYNQRQKLVAFIELCEAVSFAHGRLILHRDIKPSNILVTSQGRIKLVDFGIAGLLASPVDPEGSLYTKGYAAPEQIEGETAQVQSDVFALGMTLHELLTGALPTRLNDGSHAVDPSKVQLTGELRAIFDRATASDPDQRYLTVSALANDATAFLQHQPLAAVEPTSGYVWGKFYRRNRGLVLALGALIVALAGGIIATSIMTVRANQAAAQREVARQIAEENSALATSSSTVFAQITGQALAQGDEEVAASLAQATQTAIASLESDPVRARQTLYAISQIHDKRGDAKAVLETVAPIFAAQDVDNKATVMGLITFGVYSNFQGDSEDALAAFDRAEAIIDRAPNVYAFDGAMVAAFKAEATGEKADLEAAIARLIRTAKATPTTTDRNRNEAVNLWRQASVLENRRQRPAAAMPLMKNADRINQRIQGAKDVPDEAILYPLVDLNAQLGNFEDALVLSERLIELAQDTYGPSVPLAQRVQTRGDFLAQTGDIPAARAAYTQAAELFDTYDSQPSVQASEARLNIARTFASEGNIKGALELVDQVFAARSNLIANVPTIASLLLRKRGEVHAALGDAQKARADFDQALAAAKADGTRPDLIGQAQGALAALDTPKGD